MNGINELEKFRDLNGIVERGGIVIVGSDFFADLPVAELAQAFRLDEKVHNRSLKGVTILEVCDNLDDFVLDLSPIKVFFNLGDVEASAGMDTKEFIDSFEWLLCSVHNKCNAEIYVISVASKSDLHNKYNDALKKLCNECGCRFIDVSSPFNNAKPEISVFNAIKLYIHNELDFTAMMTMR